MVRSSNPKTISKDLNRSLERAIDSLISDINTDARDITPVKSGFARSQWRRTGSYRIGDTGVIVENRAPYIGILDRGSSRQAPNGIMTPVLNKLSKRRTRL